MALYFSDASDCYVFLLSIDIQYITNNTKRQQVITMKTVMLTTRIDHDTKLAFTQICEEVGLSTSQAIKLFTRAVINYGGIPFELKAKQPNSITAMAIQELSQGRGHKTNNITSLITELTEGKVKNVHS